MAVEPHQIFVKTRVVRTVKINDAIVQIFGVVDQVADGFIVIQWEDGRLGALPWDRGARANAYTLNIVDPEDPRVH